MKFIPTTYSFDASAKTITCQDFTALERISLITNLNTGDVIYQFNNIAKLGALVGSTLTLIFDTTSMSDSDDLMIIMEKDVGIEDGRLQVESEISVLLKAILTSLQMPRNADTTNNADRVNVINTVPVSGSVTATVASTTISALNGQQAHQMSIAAEISTWYLTQRSTIS